MTSQHPDFDAFYDDQVEARQHFPRENVWDRILQPSVLISCLVIAVTLTYNLYASTTTIQESLQLLGTSLWDGFVYIIPERLLDALDKPDNSTTTASPSMLLADRHHIAKGEKVRRILRMTRSRGYMSSVVEVRNRALSLTSSVLGFKTESDRPPGLGNMDNSCYQNSVLQGLSSLKSLPEYLSAYLQVSSADDDRDVAQTLQTLIADLNDVSNYGTTLWTPGVLKSMSTWTQQDAQEYYSKVLDDIDKSVAKAIKNTQPQHPGLTAKIDKDDTAASEYSDDSGYQSMNNSTISEPKLPRNPLEGLLAQRVACVRCGHSDGLSMIPFNCLTLSLGLNKNQHDLYERLDAYSKVEVIENVECPKCTLLKVQPLLAKLVDRKRDDDPSTEQFAELLRRLEAVEQALEEDDFEDKTLTEKCKIPSQSKVSSTKTKQIVVARPPQSLAVHMQRSVFDPSTFDMTKNSAPVNFPMTLDLGPWCLGSAGQSAADSTMEEEWLTDPRQSMIAGDLGSSRFTGPIYELRAVVTHYGRHENGHYICYRRYPRHSPPTKVIDDNDSINEPDEDQKTQPDLRANGEGRDEVGEPEMDWWRLSDHNVSMVSEEMVLSLSPGVFMLFYDCVDPTMVMTDEDINMQDAADSAGLEVTEGLASTPENMEQISEGHEDQKANGKPIETYGLKEDATPHSGNGQAETKIRSAHLVTTTASPVQAQ
ncbi:hypothetical protein F66182_8335 [Fusarium sp. NRRL 66182]|nr:hypothetical protein F66182_8335 [Fusarium sp. NRRL 66182]